MAHVRNTASALLAVALVAICCLTLTQQALADGLRVDDRMNSRQDRRDQTEDRSDDRSERVDERF